VAGGLTLDSGALIAIDENGSAGRRVWALVKEALSRDASVTLPAGALAQAWRGPNPVQIARLLQGCEIEHLDEELAKAVGRLLTRTRTQDVVDASIAIGATKRGDAIVTSDPTDFVRLIRRASRQVRIVTI
jgi:hypothetical protein